MKFSFQAQPRRFIMMLSLPVCCFNSDSVNRLSQAKFSRTCGSPNARFVLAVGHVETPMTTIFDASVTANRVRELLDAHLQTAEVIPRVRCLFAIATAGMASPVRS